MTTVPTFSPQETKDLCLQLMRADTASEVVDILQAAKVWECQEAWRLFSDTENNYSSIGNQQADAVAALIEKIINAEDARLVNACRQADIDPEGDSAPQSMRAAVAQFFEGKADPKEGDGRIADWTSQKSTTEGRKLTLAATGNKPNKGQPSLSIADQGEGQTPENFPLTFMSLNRSNKMRIPFVQGKFNMGGTGALRFCRLQLVVSRRNPALLPPDHTARDEEWAFTIVRRMPPSAGAKSSVYTYLAPIVVAGDARRGVLSFAADEMPIFPQTSKGITDAYSAPSSYGSLVKLYEYKWEGVKSNIVQAGEGLLRRVDIGLPELALPIRLFECRPYGGHAGSYETNALGLVARLDRDKADKLETDEPIGGVIALNDGTQIKLRIYVFKDKDTAKQYRNKSSGVVFGVNGQMHGTYSTDFFTRRRVNLSYLADSMLVYADCSQIDGQTREDLFMNSRDRLSLGALSRELDAKLETALREETTLKTLQLQRRQRVIQEKLADDKPLNDVLQGLLKANPTLSKLFLLGQSLPSPFPPNGTGKAGTKSGTAKTFVGKRYPEYFRFRNHDNGEELRRDAHLEQRTRVTLETDAEDAYFVRDQETGVWNVRRKIGDVWTDAGGWTTSGPRSGIAHLSLDLPEDANIGDTLEYLIEVTDPTRFDAFLMPLTLDVIKASHGGGSGPGNPTKNPNGGSGNQGGGGSTFALPRVTPVDQSEWADHDFDELSVLKAVHTGTEADPEAPVYDLFVNVDNKYLRHSQKEHPADSELLKNQFVWGFVLIGLALLQEQPKTTDGTDVASPESRVLTTTRAMGSILIPMLESIGTLAEE